MEHLDIYYTLSKQPRVGRQIEGFVRILVELSTNSDTKYAWFFTCVVSAVGSWWGSTGCAAAPLCRTLLLLQLNRGELLPTVIKAWED